MFEWFEYRRAVSFEKVFLSTGFTPQFNFFSGEDKEDESHGAVRFFLYSMTLDFF